MNKTVRLLKMFNGGGELNIKYVKKPLLFLVLLTFFAACSKDYTPEPAYSDAQMLAARLQAKAVADSASRPSDTLRIVADTAWADTLYVSYGDSTTIIDTNGDPLTGNAENAASRKY